MPFSFGRFLARGLVLFFAPQFLISAAGQSSSANHTPVPVANLHQLIQRSGYIFDGTVVSVERVADVEPGSVESVQITFRIEEAIRGTRKGQRLTIHEWGRLWNSGERYRIGERLVLFLYRPSKFGFTSAVGGARGRFAMDSAGNLVFEDARRAALSLDSVPRRSGRSTNRVNSRARAVAIERKGTE